MLFAPDTKAEINTCRQEWRLFVLACMVCYISLFSTRHPLDSPPIIRGRSFAPSRSQFELQQRGKKEEEEEEDEKHGGRMNEWNSFRHLPPPPLHAWAAPFAFDVVGNDNDEREKRGEESLKRPLLQRFLFSSLPASSLFFFAFSFRAKRGL